MDKKQQPISRNVLNLETNRIYTYRNEHDTKINSVCIVQPISPIITMIILYTYFNNLIPDTIFLEITIKYSCTDPRFK